MGYGSYSSNSRSIYEADVLTKSAAEVFTNHYTTKAEFKKVSKMSPHNLTIRESRDSENHPNSLAVIIALDVTGSMGRIPEHIVKKDLTTIMNGIIQAGVEDVQILFLGIGDHTCDKSPLQVGQFESSDELMAKWLEELYIERGGGGNDMESYNLAWLTGGWHTIIDCWEKRKQKGFIFTIGDEAFFDTINPTQIANLTGTPGEKWTAESMIAKAKEMYHVYHIHANDGSYPEDSWYGKKIIEKWKKLLGQNLLIAKKYTDIGKIIADIIVKINGKTNEVIKSTTSKTTTTESSDIKIGML